MDREGYESSFNGFAKMTQMIQGSYHQAFDGKAQKDLHLEIVVEDGATVDVIDAFVLPNVWKILGIKD